MQAAVNEQPPLHEAELLLTRLTVASFVLDGQQLTCRGDLARRLGLRRGGLGVSRPLAEKQGGDSGQPDKASAHLRIAPKRKLKNKIAD